MKTSVTEIRITDLYVRKMVEAERQKTGERTCSHTARRLLVERLGLDAAKAVGNYRRKKVRRPVDA